jgi:hypothetical protein
MYKCFQSQPDVRPFVAVAAKVDTQEVNSKLAWGADKSRKLDFSKEDAADDLVLNEIIWRSVRGAASKMPAPVRAAFVFAASGKDRDDD